MTDIQAALAEADIVSSATLAASPLIHGIDLRAGMHVDLIRAFRPDMCEADGACFSRSLVFVDTHAGAMEEAGDLLQAIAGGHLRAGVRGMAAKIMAVTAIDRIGHDLGAGLKPTRGWCRFRGH